MDPTLALAQFATLTGGAVVINIVVEAIKRAAAWSDATTQRFAPLLSLALGIILFVALGFAQGTFATGSGALEAVLGGLMAGASAGGLYDVGGKTVIRSVAGTPAGAG